MSSIKGFLFVLFALSLSMYAQSAERINGNGSLATKTFEVSDFNEIKINGTMEFYYQQTDEPSLVEVTLDQNLLDHLVAEVKNRTLTLEFKGAKVESVTKFIVKANSKWLKELRAAGNASFIMDTPYTGDELNIRANSNCLVQLKDLVKVGKLGLKVTGSANMVVANLDTEKINCDMDGSGSITLQKGKALEGVYSIVGSSDLQAFGFEVGSLNCKMTGKGLAEVNAVETLKASVLGNGEIFYKAHEGLNDIQQKVIGKGKIEIKQ